jgi:hypothetical protein
MAILGQYAHMASTMVTDLRCSNDTSYDIPSRDRSSMPTDREVKICRTYLASYLLCSSYAFSSIRALLLSS